MKKTIKFLITLLIFLMLVVPVLALAQIKTEKGDNVKDDGLVPCGKETKTYKKDEIIPATATTPERKAEADVTLTVKPCDFNDFLTLINNILYFILFLMAIPICAIMFAYAGFLLVTAGGEAAHARTKAKTIFTNALIGLVLAFAAWLIVKLI